jgi:hypothetical protein
MEKWLTIAGWVLYLAVLVFALSALSYLHRSSVIGRSITKMTLCLFGLSVVCLLLFGLTSLSKLHIAWIAPLGLLLSFSRIGLAFGDFWGRITASLFGVSWEAQAGSPEHKPRHAALRWIAVLPAAMLARVLVATLISSILFAVFPSSAWLRAPVGVTAPDDPMPDNAWQVGQTLASFFAVLAGAYTAPMRRFMVAVVLCALQVVLAIGTIALFVVVAFKDPRALANLDMGHVEAVGGAVLALIACAVVRYRTRPRLIPSAVHDKGPVE